MTHQPDQEEEGHIDEEIFIFQPRKLRRTDALDGQHQQQEALYLTFHYNLEFLQNNHTTWKTSQAHPSKLNELKNHQNFHFLHQHKRNILFATSTTGTSTATISIRTSFPSTINANSTATTTKPTTEHQHPGQCGFTSLPELWTSDIWTFATHAALNTKIHIPHLLYTTTDANRHNK